MIWNRLLIAIVIIAGLGVAALGLRFMILAEAPGEVNLAETTSAPVAGGAATFDGTWSVDTKTGTFDYDAEKFTSSWAGYRVEEELAGVGANTAVGRTPDVEGTLTISGNRITDVSISVDMTTLESDNDMRDRAIRTRGLETGRFPTATFELTEPITVANQPAEGEKIEIQANGDLTLHGVTKGVTIPIEALGSGERITIVSNFDVALANYGMERPTTARVLSVAKTGTVEMQLHFTKTD